MEPNYKKSTAKKDCVELAMKGSGNFWMDSDISDYEVKATFGRGTDTAGPGDISVKLVDNADRNVMHMYLKFLWNKAWATEYFPIDWKKRKQVCHSKARKGELQ